jgi:integrase
VARKLIEHPIAGRAERKRLAVRDKPYFRGIDPDVQLGYRKGKRGGIWLVRWYDGKAYSQRKLGTADDELSEGTLDFAAAVKAARTVVETERRNQRAVVEGEPLTVRSAVTTYVAVRDARECVRRGRAVRSDASHRLTRYVLGQEAQGKRKPIAAAPLAGIALHDLVEGDLISWRAALPPALKGSTKQRLINDLKAALNDAFAANRGRLPATLPDTVKYGLRGEAAHHDDGDELARKNEILSDEEVSRLLAAAKEVDERRGWEGDLFRLVAVLAATGARFSQVVRMRVGDVQAEAGRLMIPPSRKGKGSKSSRIPFPIHSEVLETLAAAVEERPSEAVLLERWRSKQVRGGIRWERDHRGAWGVPAELTRSWDDIRNRAGLRDVSAYSLRHSSIVRWLRKDVPIRLVAALHDTSVKMIESNYTRFIADALDDLAARAVVPLIRPDLSANGQ